MSALFNQTNIAPGTAFTTGGGGGGGSNFPNGIQVAGVATLTSDTVHGTPYFTINNISDTFLGVTKMWSLYLGRDDAGYTLYNSNNSILVQTLTGVSKQWAFADLGSNLNYNFTAISSIKANSNAEVINMNALVSTLASAFPGCVS